MKPLDEAGAWAQIVMGVLASVAFVYMIVSQYRLNRWHKKHFEEMAADAVQMRQKIAALQGVTEETKEDRPSAQA